ncbi:hypothetical protein GTH32_10955 [Alteromonas sp. 345S023]|uniref:Uncharacterized protein n=1 Tax=Alteromonas profundi TaxID=2696062 RepID=A0A7X5LLS1_9ALTE|nr:hypothetical protein [Alteromonas profundi]NDV91702.1 hypothetical protein [Alteromonas profundi]
MQSECVDFYVRKNNLVLECNGLCSEEDQLEVDIQVNFKEKKEFYRFSGGLNELSDFKMEIDLNSLPLVDIEFKVFVKGTGESIGGKCNFFSTEFIDFPNRSPDLETSAFSARQVAISTQCSLPVRICMAVVYAYNSMDLNDSEKAAESKNILNKLLQRSDELNHSNSIRHNKGHLELSVNTVLWHLNIFLEDLSEFFKCITKFLLEICTAREKSGLTIRGTMGYNLVKLTNILSYLAFSSGNSPSLAFFSKLSMSFFSEVAVDFHKQQSNANEFAVLAEVHKSVLRNILLVDILEGKEPHKGYIQKLLGIKNAEYEKDFKDNLFRLYKGKEELHNHLASLLETRSELINEEINKLKEKLSGVNL